MEAVNSAARGDIGDALSIFRGADGSISIPQNANNDDGGFDLVQIVDAYESVQSTVETVESLVNNERALTALAVDYLTKTCLGLVFLLFLLTHVLVRKSPRRSLLFDR